MAHTDKDQPHWVKLNEHEVQFVPRHSLRCGQEGFTCDLPLIPSRDYHSLATYCWWTIAPDTPPEILKEIFYPGKGTCGNARCTRCTVKKTAKRKRRRTEERELRRLAKDETL